MKKSFFGALLFALVIAVAVPATARVDVDISIGLPPIVFAAPPEVIVMPDTRDVYVVPEIDVDLFSGMVGGGVYGTVVGIARIIMTETGVTIAMSRVSILM